MQLEIKLTSYGLWIIKLLPGHPAPQNSEWNVHKLRVILQRVLSTAEINALILLNKCNEISTKEYNITVMTSL